MEALVVLCRFYIVVFSSVLFRVVLATPLAITSCPVDQYAVLNANGNGITSCHACKRCPPGYGVQRSCTATDNTVCQLCPIGKFSSRMSETETCAPCKSCDWTGLQKECSPISDSVCNKQCDIGEYYDPSKNKCYTCSYCFPDRPNARTVRIRECQSQGLAVNYQCSPLPPPDAGDTSWSPPDTIVASNSGVNAGDTHRSGSDRITIRTGIEAEVGVEIGMLDRGDGSRVSVHKRRKHKKRGNKKRDGVKGGHRSSSTHFLSSNDELSDPMAVSYDYDMVSGQAIDDFPFDIDIDGTTENVLEELEGIFEDISRQSHSATNSPSRHETSDSSSSLYEYSESSFSSGVLYDDYFDMFEGVEQTKQIQEHSPRYRQLTASDIGLVVGIALACGFVSFVTTAVTCHCLMKRGKNVGPKVSVVSGKAATNAWTYQDVMPTTVELRPQVETPPQSRRTITCV